jgi:predicted nucleotidyltransferase
MHPPFEKLAPRVAVLCRQRHIRKLLIFGSAARDEMRPDSDVDLLVEFEPGQAPSLAGFARLNEEFAGIFRTEVDLATASILRNPYRRKTILADMKELYAAA